MGSVFRAKEIVKNLAHTAAVKDVAKNHAKNVTKHANGIGLILSVRQFVEIRVIARDVIYLV